MNSNDFVNPVEAVGLISIYSYFNLLSDFLFSENYLSTNDRHKQIPVVNALYKYFDEHPDNLDPLIRSLLQGSDLYGEKIGETFDDTFVNTMFENIISSLVFNKFGNIYGFLADVVRKTGDLEIKNLFEEIKKSLEKTAFENEYGNDSLLTPLAVDRIFTDIIQLLFPQPKTDLKLLSLDYIYAQAGLILLRPGIMNAPYYSGMYAEKMELNNESLFDEYLLIGHLFEELIIEEKLGQFNVTAFALPALFVYVTEKSEKLEHEKMMNIILDPKHWLEAYNCFLSFLNNRYDKIEFLLEDDAKYNMHFSLSHFELISALDKNYIASGPDCQVVIKKKKIDPAIIYNPNESQCYGHASTGIHVHFLHNIDNIVHAFEKLDKKSLTSAFNNYFQSWDRETKVIMKLITMTYYVNSQLNQSINKSIDHFEIIFANGTLNFYSIIRENYSAKVIKMNYYSLTSEHTVTYSTEEVKKNFTQQLNVLRDEIIERRSENLKKLLISTPNQPLETDWWKDYGFSLVPFYPCLSAKFPNKTYENANECKVDTFTMFPVDNQNDEITVNLIESQTQFILTSTGTSIKILSLKKLIKKLVLEEEKSLMINTFDKYFKFTRLSEIVKYPLEFNQRILLRLSNPSYNVALKENELLNIFEDTFKKIETKSSLDYTSIINMIENIDKLCNDFVIFAIGNSNHPELNLKILSQNPLTDSGYGYKFVMLNDYSVAFLRTIDDYVSPRTVLLISTNNISTNQPIYRIINSSTLKPTSEYLYEIDNKLQTSPYSFIFNATDVADYNLQQCSSKEKQSPSLTKCPRIINKEKQKLIEYEILNRSTIELPQIPTDKLFKIIQNYVFPDEDFSVKDFFNKWKSEENLLIPQKGKKNIIERKEDLFKLRYKEWLEEENLNFTDVVKRINIMYSHRQRYLIERNTTLKDIFTVYKRSNERFSATFDDYYAIRNFAITGYKRIMADTDGAKRMKIALYNLAIRQSDDSVENFDSVLLTLESIPRKSIKKLFFDPEEYTLQKFTLTGTKIVNKITYHRKGYQNVLLKMTFSGPYLRAKIKQKFCFVHTKSILLPGTKFLIGERKYMTATGFGHILLIKLKYVHEINEKYIWYQKIMKNICKLNLFNNYHRV